MTSNSTLDQKYGGLLNPLNPTTLFSLLHALTGMFIAGRPFFIPHTQVISKNWLTSLEALSKVFFGFFPLCWGLGRRKMQSVAVDALPVSPAVEVGTVLSRGGNVDK